MSELQFKVGDRVMLHEGIYDETPSNPTSIQGIVIDISHNRYAVAWDNSYWNLYDENDLYLATSLVGELYAIIEERDATIELHEAQISELLAELNVLRGSASVVASPEQTFKPIEEYTIEDWEIAHEDAAIFEKRDGSTTVVRWFDYNDTEHMPVRTCDRYWRYLNGKLFSSEPSDNDIIKRIK